MIIDFIILISTIIVFYFSVLFISYKVSNMLKYPNKVEAIYHSILPGGWISIGTALALDILDKYSIKEGLLSFLVVEIIAITLLLVSYLFSCIRRM